MFPLYHFPAQEKSLFFKNKLGQIPIHRSALLTEHFYGESQFPVRQKNRHRITDDGVTNERVN